MIVHLKMMKIQLFLYNAGNMHLKKKIELLIQVINSLTSVATIRNSNAFYDELPADNQLFLHVITANNRIAKATRRGRGNQYALFDDHILIYYRGNTVHAEDGPCIVHNNQCVVNNNHQKYFAIIKTDMSSPVIKSITGLFAYQEHFSK